MSGFQVALPRFLSLLGPQRMFQNVQGSLWALSLGVMSSLSWWLCGPKQVRSSGLRRSKKLPGPDSGLQSFLSPLWMWPQVPAAIKERGRHQRKKSDEES